MKKSLSLSLKTVFTLFSVAATLIMLTVAFYFISNIYEEALHNESQKYFQQSKKTAQVIIDTSVEELNEAVKNIRFDKEFFDAAIKNDKAFIASYLLQKIPSIANFSGFITPKHTYASSYLLYDSNVLLEQIKHLRTATLEKKIVAVKVASDTKLFILSHKGVVDNDGKVIGIYVAATEINSANALINRIRQNTALEYVALVYGDDVITESGQNPFGNAKYDFDRLQMQNDAIAYKTMLEFDGMQSDLSIVMASYSQTLYKQNRDFLFIFAALGVFFAALIFISVILIQKIVATPLNTLKHFAKTLLDSHASQKAPKFHVKEYKQLARYLQHLFLQVKENEKKLIASKKEVEKEKNFQKTVFENSTIPTVVMDAKTFKYIDCNTAAVQKYKFASKEEVIGKTHLDVSAPAQYDGTPSKLKAISYIKEAFEKGSIVFEWLHQRDNGEFWDGEVHLLYFTVDNKEMIQFSIVDITERKRAKEQIQTLNKTLEQKVIEQTKALRLQLEEIKNKDKMLQEQAKLAAMGEMISAIAHQWRQPLNALSINIQNLDYDYEEGLIDAAFINDFIMRQNETIEFMSKTIDDFRSFFKTDKVKKEFSIKGVATNVASLVSAQFANNGIKLQIQGDDFVVNGFESEMKQVMLNLLSNAKDAILERKIKNGQVVIGMRSDTRKITVTDNGGGVASDKIDRIFEPYYTTKEHGKGTGIGLFMSRIIVVEHMNATIKGYNVNDGFCVEMGFGLN
jgi:PAS domain S-box-containing protein